MTLKELVKSNTEIKVVKVLVPANVFGNTYYTDLGKFPVAHEAYSRINSFTGESKYDLKIKDCPVPLEYEVQSWKMASDEFTIEVVLKMKKEV